MYIYILIPAPVLTLTHGGFSSIYNPSGSENCGFTTPIKVCGNDGHMAVRRDGGARVQIYIRLLLDI